jgi:hypothetical protein
VKVWLWTLASVSVVEVFPRIEPRPALSKSKSLCFLRAELRWLKNAHL